ncbi:MAG TPA: aminoglycoside phosphotransferase family protein [Parafilimonas sp.]|nr:aminoglycoside phosphotransferase family protein [Parafilimonas sp.]
MEQLLAAYGMRPAETTVQPFGSGLINSTWIVASNGHQYILQKINKAVFTRPDDIDRNIHAIDHYLTNRHPSYTFITPLPAVNGETLLQYEDEYYRLFKFISSTTYVSAPDASVAFEAARQFGMFTKFLSGFDANTLEETIPHFHDIDLRYSQFLRAIEHGNNERIGHSAKLIASLQRHESIVSIYKDIRNDSSFKKRVTHHDTKISNVLFDENNKGICIIDLDTVMPGYFISDIGDMMRTYLAAATEEETNFDLIEVRDDFFKAIVEGYLGQMIGELSKQEVNAFVYSGKFLIYMQALRFLTDYLNDDVYYGARYELHNFNRARNQLRLLECLVEKEELYNSIVRKFVG